MKQPSKAMSGIKSSLYDEYHDTACFICSDGDYSFTCNDGDCSDDVFHIEGGDGKIGRVGVRASNCSISAMVLSREILGHVTLQLHNTGDLLEMALACNNFGGTVKSAA